MTQETNDKETTSLGQGVAKQNEDPRKATEARKYEEEWEVDKEALKENTNSCRLGFKYCTDSEDGEVRMVVRKIIGMTKQKSENYLKKWSHRVRSFPSGGYTTLSRERSSLWGWLPEPT